MQEKESIMCCNVSEIQKKFNPPVNCFATEPRYYLKQLALGLNFLFNHSILSLGSGFTNNMYTFHL